MKLDKIENKVRFNYAEACKMYLVDVVIPSAICICLVDAVKKNKFLKLENLLRDEHQAFAYISTFFATENANERRTN